MHVISYDRSVLAACLSIEVQTMESTEENLYRPDHTTDTTKLNMCCGLIHFSPPHISFR